MPWNPSESDELAVEYVWNFFGFYQPDIAMVAVADYIDDGMLTIAQAKEAKLPVCEALCKTWWTENGGRLPVCMAGPHLLVLGKQLSILKTVHEIRTVFEVGAEGDLVRRDEIGPAHTAGNSGPTATMEM